MKYILFIIVFGGGDIQIDRIGFDDIRHCENVRSQINGKHFVAGPTIVARCLKMF